MICPARKSGLLHKGQGLGPWQCAGWSSMQGSNGTSPHFRVPCEISNNNKEATNIHTAKAKHFNIAVLRSMLSKWKKKITYSNFVSPSITFPLSSSSMLMEEFKSIRRPSIPKIWHGRRVHRNIKQTYLFGPSTFDEYKITSLEVSTKKHIWKCFVTTSNVTTRPSNC